MQLLPLNGGQMEKSSFHARYRFVTSGVTWESQILESRRFAAVVDSHVLFRGAPFFWEGDRRKGPKPTAVCCKSALPNCAEHRDLGNLEVGLESEFGG